MEHFDACVASLEEDIPNTIKGRDVCMPYVCVDATSPVQTVWVTYVERTRVQLLLPAACGCCLLRMSHAWVFTVVVTHAWYNSACFRNKDFCGLRRRSSGRLFHLAQRKRLHRELHVYHAVDYMTLSAAWIQYSIITSPDALRITTAIHRAICPALAFVLAGTCRRRSSGSASPAARTRGEWRPKALKCVCPSVPRSHVAARV